MKHWSTATAMQRVPCGLAWEETLGIPSHPTGATIESRLLGPITASVGQPLTLCWRLERGPGAPGGKDVVLHYEVAAQVGGGKGGMGRACRDVCGRGRCAPTRPTPAQTSSRGAISQLTLEQGPGWSPAGARCGSVRLGAWLGAVATVEAGWVPLLPGSLAAPRLTMQGMHCQARSREGVCALAQMSCVLGRLRLDVGGCSWACRGPEPLSLLPKHRRRWTWIKRTT